MRNWRGWQTWRREQGQDQGRKWYNERELRNRVDAEGEEDEEDDDEDDEEDDDDEEPRNLDYDHEYDEEHPFFVEEDDDNEELPGRWRNWRAGVPWRWKRGLSENAENAANS